MDSPPALAFDDGSLLGWRYVLRSPERPHLLDLAVLVEAERVDDMVDNVFAVFRQLHL
ncbi:hypothetical protein [Aestuariivirga sp.]|uniref:hypothetical protein n=1 Tax=Aestuariivirga sp. TaxID=2650926 RepID=UPI0039E2E422